MISKKTFGVDVILGYCLLTAFFLLSAFFQLILEQSKSLYFLVYSISIILLFNGFYLAFLSSKVEGKNKKIEMFILFLSASIIFASFFSSSVGSMLDIENSLNVLGYDYSCPQNITNLTDFNYIIFNSDMSRGIGISLKFVGKNICISSPNGCEEEYKSIPHLIYSNSNLTFYAQLKKVDENKPAQFYVMSYNNAGYFISKSTICKYD
jgi:hypothetical protein